jgi:DNA-binding NarL/FixJ family response regulator
VLFRSNEITYVPRAKELGASAFVYKNNKTEYYLEVAHRVLKGETIFPESKTITMPNGKSPFSEREMEILKYLCKHGDKNKIAEELCISVHTVKRHIESMLDKSGFSKTIDLVVYVVSNGWINPNF